MDRCARPRHPAVALRRGLARCRGDVADRARASDRRDPAGHRQALEDARRADRTGGARGDRRLCAAVPLSAERRRAAVRRRPGRAAQSRIWCGARSRRRGGGWACPTRSRRMRSATASRRICWRGARTCERFRNCSATPACRRRKSIRRSTRRGCSTSIATPTPAPEQRPCERALSRRADIVGQPAMPRQGTALDFNGKATAK